MGERRSREAQEPMAFYVVTAPIGFYVVTTRWRDQQAARANVKLICESDPEYLSRVSEQTTMEKGAAVWSVGSLE